MKDKAILEICEHLAEIDRQCIINSEPILSVLVRTDDDAVNPVTLASILKYDLALPNESLNETIVRLQQEAFAFAQRKI